VDLLVHPEIDEFNSIENSIEHFLLVLNKQVGISFHLCRSQERTQVHLDWLKLKDSEWMELMLLLQNKQQD